MGVDDVPPFTQGFPSGQRDQTVTLTRKLRWFESTPLHQIFRFGTIGTICVEGLSNFLGLEARDFGIID